MTNILNPQEMADQAKKTYQAGDYVQAAQEFAGAASVYAGLADALMSAEMKNNQSVALLLAGEAQAALDAVIGRKAVRAGFRLLRALVGQPLRFGHHPFVEQ